VRPAALALALGIAAVVALAACDSAPLPKVDKPLVLLARPTLDGRMLDVSAYAGHVVVVNFWSPG
jgi:hypothetical protein